jgi:hypothetical protein
MTSMTVAAAHPLSLRVGVGGGRFPSSTFICLPLGQLVHCPIPTARYGSNSFVCQEEQMLSRAAMSRRDITMQSISRGTLSGHRKSRSWKLPVQVQLLSDFWESDGEQCNVIYSLTWIDL